MQIMEVIILQRTRAIMMQFKRVLLLVAISVMLPFFANAKVFLVSVGISDYPGKVNDLRLPAKDAQLVTWLYSQNADVNFMELLDTNATRANIIEAMEKIFPKAGKDDVVVLYFSGHGVPGSFCAYDEDLSYEEVRRCMSESKSHNKMIFADACFSGKIRTNETASEQEHSRSYEKTNVILFLSSRSNETSLELPYMKNGLFTTYLQKGLGGRADFNNDRIITAKEIFRYVYDNVVRMSQKKQHPVMWGKFSDDMPVISWK